jgi:hypothetical protein
MYAELFPVSIVSVDLAKITVWLGMFSFGPCVSVLWREGNAWDETTEHLPHP